MKIKLEKYTLELTVKEYVELVGLEGFDELIENLSSLEMASEMTKESIDDFDFDIEFEIDDIDTNEHDEQLFEINLDDLYPVLKLIMTGDEINDNKRKPKFY